MELDIFLLGLIDTRILLIQKRVKITGVVTWAIIRNGHLFLKKIISSYNNFYLTLHLHIFNMADHTMGEKK